MKGGLNVRNALVVLGALFLATPLLGASTVRNEESAQKARDNSKYEAWLQKQVRHELLMLPYYSVFDNLEYRIDGDRVILSGQVMRPVLKSDAENAVKKIEGVSKVVNHIEVFAVHPHYREPRQCHARRRRGQRDGQERGEYSGQLRSGRFLGDQPSASSKVLRHWGRESSGDSRHPEPPGPTF